MVQALLVLVLFLALLIAIFALQNAGWVPIQLLFWRFNVSLVLVILGSALFGACAVLLIGLFRRGTRAGKRARKDAPALEAPAPAPAPPAKTDE